MSLRLAPGMHAVFLSNDLGYVGKSLTFGPCFISLRTVRVFMTVGELKRMRHFVIADYICTASLGPGFDGQGTRI